MTTASRHTFPCKQPLLLPGAALLLVASAAFLVWPDVAVASVPETSGSPHGDLSLECSICHSSDSWKPAQISDEFDHSEGGFPLAGAHQAVECMLCHTDLQFAAVSPECSSCHQDVHEGQFGIDCARCHQTQSFIDRPAQIDMHRTTRFPLTGSHVTLDCDQCHTSTGQGTTTFVNTPTACYACHRTDYVTAKNPDHVAGQMSQECSVCHSTVFWEGTQVAGSHSFFPLSGGHGGLACDDCHVGNQFSGMRSDCFSCHEADYRTTSNPDHGQATFSTDCSTCHTIASWTGVQYRHLDFQLTGAHRAVDCSSCHATGVYAGLSTDCYFCHQQDYVAAVDPNHVQSQFDTDCSVCHTTTTWVGATFDHTSFPLTGGHNGLDCASCHASGTFVGLDTACYSCHQQDYVAAVDPNHVQSQFDTDCTVCHSTVTWTGATFDHTSFALTGGHSGLDCVSCHASGVYVGLDADCYACHQSDYEATTNPEHKGAGFGFDCASCHDTNAWEGATFDHQSFFPIASGNHRADCVECHTVATDYSTFTCFTCHEHNQSSMDSKHRGESGYAYDSNLCYDCHPRGRH